MNTSRALSITGFSLIAVTYGMARFSWGLMLPAVIKEIPFSTGTAGAISACSFAAYCLAIISTPVLIKHFGSRGLAAAAAFLAAAGLLILAFSFSPLMLAVGLSVAGLSPGMASPSLAVAVNQLIAAKRQSQINTFINAGTSAGIILSVPILLLLPGGWRAACLVFGTIALVCLLPVLRYLPADKVTSPVQTNSSRWRMPAPAMVRLMAIAFASGIISAAWWSFGPQILQQHAGVDAQTISWLWMIAGGAGISGVLTGPVAKRIGMNLVYRGALLLMVLPLVVLAIKNEPSGWFYPAAAMCGAGYIILSGVLLVWGISANENDPASGVGLVFLMLAVGQVAGSVLFGQLYTHTHAATALLTFGALGIGMMPFTPAAPHKT